MNNCGKFPDVVNLYIDNELTDYEKIKFEKHLQNCDECSQDYYELMLVSNIFSESFNEELPENYNSILRERIQSNSDSQTLQEEILDKTVIDLNQKSQTSGKSRLLGTLSKLSFAATAILVLGIFIKAGYFENFINSKNMFDSSSIDNRVRTQIHLPQNKFEPPKSEIVKKSEKDLSTIAQSSEFKTSTANFSKVDNLGENNKSTPELQAMDKGMLGQMKDQLEHPEKYSNGDGLKFKGTATMGVGVGKTPEEAMQNAIANQQSAAVQGGYESNANSKPGRLLSGAEFTDIGGLGTMPSPTPAALPQTTSQTPIPAKINLFKDYLYFFIAGFVLIIYLLFRFIKILNKKKM